MSEDGFKNAFHNAEESRGAEFHEDGGWLWTERFADDPDGSKGYHATRDDVSVWNVSPLIKWKFVGPDAAKALDRIGTNKVEDLKVGGVRYSLLLDEEGALVDEGTVYRVADDTLYYMINTDGDEMQAELEKRSAGLNVTISNPSRTMPNIAIQGPNALKLLSGLTSADVASLKYFNFLTEPVEFAGAQVMLTRTGYSGEKGYEIFLMDPADADKVYDAVVAAGAYPIGTDSVLMYRAESGLVIAGVDYASEQDPKTNPYDLSLDHAIKLDHDFVGKAGIEASAKAPANRYVTLKLEGDEESGYGADVTKDGKKVGLAPSPAVSPRFGAITLATVPTALATPGTELEVEGRKAVVDVNPLYDTKKERPARRGTSCVGRLAEGQPPLLLWEVPGEHGRSALSAVEMFPPSWTGDMMGWMSQTSEDDRRHVEERPEWAWSTDLRDAYREALSTVLDANAVLVASVPEAARPAPRRSGSRLA